MGHLQHDSTNVATKRGVTPSTPEDLVAMEIANKLIGAGLTVAGGLRQSGLFEKVEAWHMAGVPWEAIGERIGWSPINARECFILEGGTLE